MNIKTQIKRLQSRSVGISAGTAAGRFPAREAATLVTLHQAATLPWHQHRHRDRARHTLRRGVPSDPLLHLMQLPCSAELIGRRLKWW